MKTELKQEILSAFNERIEDIVDGQPGGVFFVGEAIELAKAERAVERILNIPHSEQGLVKEYLHGFMNQLPEFFAHQTDLLLIRMILFDATTFFLNLDHSTDRVVEGLVQNGGWDVETDELVDRAIRYAWGIMKADVEIEEGGRDLRMKDKRDGDPLDFDSWIPF